MFETFWQSNEARIYIKGSDGADRDHSSSVAMVGRAWGGASGATRPEPLLLHGRPGGGHGDLRASRQRVFAAADPQDHALPATRVRQASDRDGFRSIGVSPSDRWNEDLSGEFGTRDHRYLEE